MTAGIHAIPLRKGNKHKYGFCSEISIKQRSVLFPTSAIDWTENLPTKK
jgi:hypothetical protein